MDKFVRVKLTKRKETPSRVYSVGDMVTVEIKENGDAITSIHTILKPDEYQIFIPDYEYESLLQGGGDVVA